MPARISDNIRQEVIKRRIFQQPFEKIASDLGISHGSAVSIEKQWRMDLGATDANAVLDLAKVMKKLRMVPAQCATGLAIDVILREMGAKPDGVEKFLSELMEELIARGTPANKAAAIIQEMHELAQRSGVPLVEVPDLLNTALTNLGETEAKLADISRQHNDVQKELRSALDEMHMTKESLGMCVEVEGKLKELGLSLSKIDDIITVIRNVEGLDQDPANGEVVSIRKL